MPHRLREILLVDDSPSDQYLHRRLLERLDCADRITEAAHGRAALEHLQSSERPPDLIFLDINMPLMNGWEFLEAYAKLPEERRSRAVIVMLTTSSNPDDRERAARWSELVSGYIEKPLDVTEMESILRDYFAP